LVEAANIVDAVAEHRQAVDTHPKCPAAVDLRVVAGPGQHVGMHHAGAEDLDPAGAATRPAALAVAERAVDRHVDARLDEREVVATEAHAPLSAEDLASKLGQR